jgi:CarD family transcriptional regulator
MAARKQSAKNGRGKNVRKKAAASTERQQRQSRPAPKKKAKSPTGTAGAKKAAARTAAAAKKPRAPAKNESRGKNEKSSRPAEGRKETQRRGKTTPTAGAKKILNPAGTGLAVGDKSNGKVVDGTLKAVDGTLKAKSPPKVKAQVGSEEILKVEKTGVATVAGAKAVEAHSAVGERAPSQTAAPLSAKQKPATKEEPSAASKAGKPASQRQGFKLNEFVVYPAHGVGQIVAIEEQEVVGFKLELFVINFSKDKMTLRVPTSKVAGVGMRKISDPDTAKRSLDILSGRARIKRTMWSRRAQEYETKINSGDIAAIAEVVRDLYRSEAQPEQSYSERQLYEAALDRMVREIAAVQKSNEIDALKAIEGQLQKTHNRPAKAGADVSDPEIEEAA